jgi:hypothetical protein
MRKTELIYLCKTEGPDMKGASVYALISPYHLLLDSSINTIKIYDELLFEHIKYQHQYIIIDGSVFVTPLAWVLDKFNLNRKFKMKSKKLWYHILALNYLRKKYRISRPLISLILIEICKARFKLEFRCYECFTRNLTRKCDICNSCIECKKLFWDIDRCSECHYFVCEKCKKKLHSCVNSVKLN